MTRIGKLIGGRSRSEGNCEAIFQIAREVVERRRSMQGALNEVRHPAILDNLSDEDFRLLGRGDCRKRRRSIRNMRSCWPG